jgi:hypothetical protein
MRPCMLLIWIDPQIQLVDGNSGTACFRTASIDDCSCNESYGYSKYTVSYFGDNLDIGDARLALQYICFRRVYSSFDLI